MKRWWWLPILLILIVFAWWRLQGHEQAAPPVATNTTTQPQREPANDNDQEPAPAPVPSTTEIKTPKKREWLGNKDQLLKSGRITFKNKVSTDWPSKLQKQLARGLPPDVTLSIHPERDFIMLEGDQALNTQQVIVVFEAKNNRNSFRAMVDSQTGKIIRTWDQTIHENTRRPSSLRGLPLQVDEN